MKTENKKPSSDKKPAPASTRKSQRRVRTPEEEKIYSDIKYEEKIEVIAQPKKRKSGFSFFTKLVLFTVITSAIVFVSLNITPILKYALQDQNSAIYPILKKYADELRLISSRLTSVTRRLNMLSVISEKNNLDNISNVNRLVLQINDMWTTTKKYLNLIGIETTAYSKLEKEIDANSKSINNNVIQDSKVEQIFPEDHFTLTNILNLDSIVQDLNIEIDNIDNEITYLENNVYASIKASNIYSQLLDRSRNTEDNFYSESPVTNDSTYPINTIQAITIPENTGINNTLNIKQDNNEYLASEPVQQQNLTTSNTNTLPPVEKVKQVTKVKKIKENIAISATTPVIKKAKILPTVKPTPKKATVTTPPKIKVAKIEKPVKEPLKKVIISNTVIRKDQSNALVQDKPTAPDTSIRAEEEAFGSNAFDSPSLLDDVTLDFNAVADDYGDIEIKNTEVKKTAVEEEDDYTGG